MCVCMFVCMSVCMYVSNYVCSYVSVYIYIDMYPIYLCVYCALHRWWPFGEVPLCSGPRLSQNGCNGRRSLV